jgi:hypothetical protein
MLSFRQFINHSNRTATVAVMNKIVALDRQIQQDRKVSEADKIISTELLTLAVLLGTIPGDKERKVT